jgi:hypothetical protein
MTCAGGMVPPVITGIGDAIPKRARLLALRVLLVIGAGVAAESGYQIGTRGLV